MRWVWAILLGVACDARPGTTAEPAAPVAAAPAEAARPATSEPATSDPVTTELPAAPVFAAGPFEVRVGKGSPLPPSKAFAERGSDGMQEHPWALGWTEDGAAFAYCTIVSGESCKLCTYTGRDGTTERLLSGQQCDADRTEKKVTAKLLKARLVERKVEVRDGVWAFGGDLVVTSREVTGAPDSDGEPRAVLKIGAARRDGAAEGDSYAADACTRDKSGTTCFREAHADAVVASPDGALVAVVGHMWEGEWSDTFTVAILPAGQLAAEVFNRQGLAALARRDFERAAEAFLAAMHADAAAWKGPYNLACAYAGAGDARVQPALRAALERGGEAVRKRAATDRDLDGVRGQAWFAAVMQPPG
jgi:hypothetical protein